jgi:hypothetical protein
MAHGMQPGLFYRALQEGNDAFIQGHFHNGRFYDGPRCLGKIDDDGTFRYFQSEGSAHAIAPEHVAGQVDGLVLCLNDGSRFHLIEVDRHTVETP